MLMLLRKNITLKIFVQELSALKLFKQFTIIIFLSFLGEILHMLIPFQEVITQRL